MADGSSQPRILAIHAHPDDVEFQIAGTLALLKEKGCHITIATMTAGDLGSAELSQTEIANIRRKEAKTAADMLGADYMCLEFGDLAIVVDDASRRRVTEAIRRARPNIVITAPPVDYMADHEVTSRLVRDALFSASVPFYKTNEWDAAPPPKRFPTSTTAIRSKESTGSAIRFHTISLSTSRGRLTSRSGCSPPMTASGPGCGDSMASMNIWMAAANGVGRAEE